MWDYRVCAVVKLTMTSKPVTSQWAPNEHDTSRENESLSRTEHVGVLKLLKTTNPNQLEENLPYTIPPWYSSYELVSEFRLIAPFFGLMPNSTL